jgi:alkylresorcinol/alkylpyrone synthase
MAYIAATKAALPRYCYGQPTLAALFKKYCVTMDYDLDPELIDGLFTNTTIQERNFALPLDTFFDPPSRHAANGAALAVAVEMSTKLVRELLDEAGIAASEISYITSMMTTVISIPTLEARVMEHIDFPDDVKRVPLNGLGCMGGAAGVARVNDYLVGHPEEAALLLCVELGGSMYWQGGLQGYLKAAMARLPEEPGLFPEVVSQIISGALFGDCLTAVLLVGDRHRLASPERPRVVDNRSITLRGTVAVMNVDVMDDGFKNVLSPDVPQYASSALRRALGSLLEKPRLSIGDLRHFMIHPGGPKVLQVVQDDLGLPDEALRLSRDVLARIGNVSAPTVLYMLDEAVRRGRPAPGSHGVMASMGPGFSEEAVLIQW